MVGSEGTNPSEPIEDYGVCDTDKSSMIYRTGHGHVLRETNRNLCCKSHENGDDGEGGGHVNKDDKES